ncbi:MAG: U32 family peptidase C-terminal domain-containing protein [Burkholderiales bacterium]|nr:U32 family peptidase C-terminal domain-containing protein [Burkholderiales bacterium]
MPELLSPAGSLKTLRYAFAYGADAVYAGLPRYSLRVRNNEFSTLASLKEGIDCAHALNKKFLLAVNVLPHNRKVDTFIDDLKPIVALKPDALIMADAGLIMLARQHFSEIPIHVSVQANTVNYAAVRFWENLGATRVILSRELSISEIALIRERCPNIELEVFVHGALCIAYSGRCLLSGYFNHRDGNQGTCTNACRWRYRVSEGVNTDDALLPQPYLLEEMGRREHEYMEIDEDEHGTYILNSRDLRAVQHIQQLTDIGIDCFKIEGRTKSHYYCARVTRVYRRAIDDAVCRRPFNPQLLTELNALANRGYTEGFFNRHAAEDTQNYADGASSSFTERFVAEVEHYDETTGYSDLIVKNHFEVGDTLTLITPDETRTRVLTALWNQDHQPINVAPGSGHRVRAQIGKTDTMTLIAGVCGKNQGSGIRGQV